MAGCEMELDLMLVWASLLVSCLRTNRAFCRHVITSGGRVEERPRGDEMEGEVESSSNSGIVGI